MTDTGLEPRAGVGTGTAGGIILGLVGAFGGLIAFLLVLVLVLGAVGLLVGRLAETGEPNLSRLSERRR